MTELSRDDLTSSIDKLICYVLKNEKAEGSDPYT